jgi:nitric oxide reductase subunit B
MMGVYGMLAVGLALFCIRYLIPEARWSDRAAKISFWSLNVGLAWMVFATLFPLGLLQLYESVNHGYFEARTLKYVSNDVNALIEWLRLPGDAIFIVGGVLPLLYLCWLGIRYAVPGTIFEEPVHAALGGNGEDPACYHLSIQNLLRFTVLPTHFLWQHHLDHER